MISLCAIYNGATGRVAQESGRDVQVHDRLWSDFSFVASSGYREKVIGSLAFRPKLPGQVADESKLRVSHVSRSLRELSKRGLVECLTPMAKSRGRLYGLTKTGSALAAYRQNSSQRFSSQRRDSPGIGFVPKLRAAVIQGCIQQLRLERGSEAAREALKDWSVTSDELTEDMWLSADAVDEFNELLESRFGDGTYDFIRSLYSQAGPRLSSVKEALLKIIPLEALAERAPIVWNKEWNFGRLVVTTSGRRAVFQHFDMVPAPSFCAIFQGVYEGVLKARKVSGTVTKTRGIRSGDDHCEYIVQW